MKASKPNSRLALVSSEILLGSRAAAQELDIDINDVLLEYDIDPQLLVSPEGYLTRRQVAGFLNTVAGRFDANHFGLLVGKHQPPLRLGRLKPIFELSPDVKSAIENTFTYQPLYSEAPVHRFAVEQDYARISRWDQELSGSNAIQLHTLVIVQIFKILKALCGSQWSPSSISFSHATPAQKQAYLRFFQCPVYFDREFDGVVFPERDLHRKIDSADPDLLSIVRAHYDELLRSKEREPDDTMTAVSDYIRRQLSTNLCNMESCARYFDLHPRTLQRTLTEHGHTFKGLLSTLRMELAMHYLQSSSMPLTDLAEMLGYRNPSAFTRAFKNAQGMSPVDWKKTNGG